MLGYDLESHCTQNTALYDFASRYIHNNVTVSTHSTVTGIYRLKPQPDLYFDYNDHELSQYFT